MLISKSWRWSFRKDVFRISEKKTECFEEIEACFIPSKIYDRRRLDVGSWKDSAGELPLLVMVMQTDVVPGNDRRGSTTYSQKS